MTLLTYGMGAATALAARVLVGSHLPGAIKQSIRWIERLRGPGGATVIAAGAIVWLGLDSEVLARWPSSTATSLEQNLLVHLRKDPAMITQANSTLAVPRRCRPSPSTAT